jgi:NTP pyrophosphatase (non-canonical NTP hydrolase)
MVNPLQRKMHDWINNTLGTSSNEPYERARKLGEEAQELKDALSQENIAEAKRELADCYLTCLALAEVLHIDLDKVAKAKFIDLTQRVYVMNEDGQWIKVPR